MIKVKKIEKIDAKIHLATWQSLQNEDYDFFSDYDAVIYDEVHLAKATQSNKIITSCENAKIKVGFTGSFEKDSIHETMQLKALFGERVNLIKTHELIEQGLASEISINCLILKYPEFECKKVSSMLYNDEIQYILTHPERNKIITNICDASTENTLILFRYKEHGKHIVKLLQEKYGDSRNIFYIDGDIPVDDRELIRAYLESNTNCILVASYKTYSTGINIKNLHNLIFAHPIKKQSGVTQAIGRLLRLFKNKDAIVWDVADDFNYKKKTNTTYNHHFAKRLELYIKSQFNYKIINLEVPKQKKGLPI